MAVKIALVEVARLVINWPSQTAARYQTKKVIDNKHFILLRKLKVFRMAITSQDTAFGSVYQVHPLTNTLAYRRIFADVIVYIFPH